jgi:hypothetical protein
MTYHDPRLDLEALRAEDLYAIASNEAATHRELALRILVERGSLLAVKDNLAAESHALILDNPIILKRIDPAAAVTALSMPGVIECIADAQMKRQALAKVLDKNNASHTQSIASLETTVSTNKAANGQALHDAFVKLWTYFARQNWQITEDAAAQKAAFDREIATLQEVHARDVQAAAERLRLLERSTRRKLVDWAKSRWARLRKKGRSRSHRAGRRGRVHKARNRNGSRGVTRLAGTFTCACA